MGWHVAPMGEKKIWQEFLKEGDHLEDLGIDGR
jgi:hypothetical protein